jgi:hypothetical protein
MLSILKIQLVIGHLLSSFLSFTYTSTFCKLYGYYHMYSYEYVKFSLFVLQGCLEYVHTSATKLSKKRNVFKHVTKCKNLIFANTCHSRFDFHYDFNSIEAPLCNILYTELEFLKSLWGLGTEEE